MGEYVVTLARSAEKEIIDLPMTVAGRVRQAIDELVANPRPHGCKKLKQAHKRWRIRVGNYRILYSIDDLKRVVDIEMVRHRRDVYR